MKDVARAYEEGLVVQTFREWEKLSCSTSEDRDSTYPGGCTGANAFWRTIIRDTIRDYQEGEKIRRANPTDGVSYTRFRRWLTVKSDTNRTEATANANFTNFRKSFFIATQYQNFFTTYRGHMGLGDAAQSNDEIWILCWYGQNSYLTLNLP